MSLRFRRSIKIIPGVKINFNKNSVGLTLGGRGAHYTINSSGRRTVSAGLPGTGLWWQESSGGGRSRRVSPPEPETPLYEKPLSEKPKPSFFAKHYENAIYDAMQDMNQKKFEAIVNDYPNESIFAKFMLVTIMCSKPETGRAGLAIAEEVWQRREELIKNDMYLKYAPGIKTQMPIIPGISYTGPYTVHLLGYLLFELYVTDETYEKAEKVLSEISPDFYTPLAKMELDYLQKKYDEVIKETNSPDADTNESAARELYRAMTFRETGDLDAAVLLLTEVTKNRSLDKALIMRSRYERGVTYLKSGDTKKALADFEFIVSKNGDYLDTNDYLKKLRNNEK